jgi:hypothetical protein
MFVRGRRRTRPVGLFGPTDDEVRSSMEDAMQAQRVVPKGVYRYRTHAEANAAADRWAVEGLVMRARELRETRRKAGFFGGVVRTIRRIWPKTDR